MQQRFSSLVKPKKYLGQHFLKDDSIAQRIVNSLDCSVVDLLEIGPGMGVLTRHILEKSNLNFYAVEVDDESIAYLNANFPSLKLIHGDFLKLDLRSIFSKDFAIIGNFPYNISSQILFKLFDNRDCITSLVGMFQKEVAERVAAKPKSKAYGILSVLLGAYYNVEYLFTVDEHVFNPPPKVKSAVIRLSRNDVERLDCDEDLFVKIVKTGFNQRRKTLRNALKPLGLPLDSVGEDVLMKRAEELSVADYVSLTSLLDRK